MKKNYSGTSPVFTGLDVLEKTKFKKLDGMKVSLLVNQASVNKNLTHASTLFSEARNIKLVSLMGPQHGIFGTTQDNMIEFSDAWDERLGIPVHSLYSNKRKPTPEILENIDALVIDLQDVGARYYTFIWTAKLCMEACAENNKKLIILDRPNPINGIDIEGNLLKKEFRSFVGLYEIPIRHGLTIGELLTVINAEEKTRCDLEVIKAEGWRRDTWFDETDLPWVMPSPNMPTLDTATVYPGACLLEATSLSEGRGTCRPFEICGAPGIDPYVLSDKLNNIKLPGVFFRPIYFEPTFNKHARKICGGVQVHVTDRTTFKPVKTYVWIIGSIKKLFPKTFSWKEPPYEYEFKKMPVDILWGDGSLREALDEKETNEAVFIKFFENPENEAFYNRIKKYFLY